MNKHEITSNIEILTRLLQMIGESQQNLSKQSRLIKRLKRHLASELTSDLFGKFEPIHGWLTCLSYINEKKISVETRFINYSANTQILDSNTSSNLTEFQTYCQYVKEKSHSFRERFMISGKHWSCGEVRIDSQGNVSIFILDSFPTYFKTRLDEIDRTFVDRPVKVYIPDLALQRDTHSCAIYAIDGWRKLEKVGSYLPVGYNGDLFDYFQQNSLLESSSSHMQLLKVQLPLYLMKLMQSKILITRVIAGRENEKNLVVNGKGETAHDACIKHFTTDSNGDIFRNTHVHDKKNKFRARAIEILSNPEVPDEYFRGLIKTSK